MSSAAMWRVLLVLLGAAWGRYAQREDSSSLQHKRFSRDDLRTAQLAGMLMKFSPALASRHRATATRSSSSSLAGTRYALPQMVKAKQSKRLFEEDDYDEDFVVDDVGGIEEEPVELYMDKGDMKEQPLMCDLLGELKSKDGTATYGVLLPMDDTVVLGKLIPSDTVKGLPTMVPLDGIEGSYGNDPPELVKAATKACAEKDIEILDTPGVLSIGDAPDWLSREGGGNVLFKDEDDDEEAASEGLLLAEFEHESHGKVAVVMAMFPYYMVSKEQKKGKYVVLNEEEFEDEEIMGPLAEMVEELDEYISEDWKMGALGEKDEYGDYYDDYDEDDLFK